MKIINCLFMLIFMISSVSAQRGTYVGIEAGVSSDIYRISEKLQVKEKYAEGTALKNVRPLSIMYGVNIRYDLSSRFFLETGIYSKKYSSAIGFKSESGYSSFTEFMSLLIPIKLGARINLLNDKLHLTPNVGYAFVKNFIRDASGMHGEGSGNNNANFRYQYTHRSTHYSNSHSLIQAGIGLELKLTKNLLVVFSGNYYKGFSRVINQDVHYLINNESMRSAQIKTDGSMKTYNLGIKVKLPALKF